jgi:hypothetical protein
MDLGEWGEPVASYEADPDTAKGLRATAVGLLVLGAAGVFALTARGRGLFDDGLFLVPAILLVVGATFLVVVTSARRTAMAVGDGWFVQRTGLHGPPRGFRRDDVVRLRTTAPSVVQGRRVVALVVETAAGQRHRVSFLEVPETSAVRAELSRQLLATGADRDPAAEALLRSQAGPDVDPLVVGGGGTPDGAPDPDLAARLDEDGQLRWPPGTGLMVFRIVILMAVGLMSLALALARSGIYRDGIGASGVALVAVPLGLGGFLLWRLVSVRRADLARWRRSRPSS